MSDGERPTAAPSHSGGSVDELVSEREASDGDAGVNADDMSEPDAELVASLWPWSRRDAGAAVEIVVYVVTGRHGGLRIPESFCRECHRFVHAADVAAERVDTDVDVRVVSWWTHLPFALGHGGYHPPVMVVDGTRLCQGYDVPTPDEVVAAIEEALR